MQSYDEKACLEPGDGVGGDGGVGASHVRRGIDIVEWRGEHIGLRCGGRVGGRGDGGDAAAGHAAAERRGERPRWKRSKGEAAGTSGEGGAGGAEEGPPGGHGCRHREEDMDGGRGFGSRVRETSESVEGTVDWSGALRCVVGLDPTNVVGLDPTSVVGPAISFPQF